MAGGIRTVRFFEGVPGPNRVSTSTVTNDGTTTGTASVTGVQVLSAANAAAARTAIGAASTSQITGLQAYVDAQDAVIGEAIDAVALDALPTRRATGLQLGGYTSAGSALTIAAANRAALQAQWDAAAADGEWLVIPRRSDGLYWTLTATGADPLNRYCLSPSDPSLYYGLLFEDGAGLALAANQLSNSASVFVIRFLDHLAGGYVGSVWGRRATIWGNTANQAGYTDGYVQGERHDLIGGFETVGGGTRNLTLRGLRLLDSYGHPINFTGSNTADTYGTGRQSHRYLDLYCEDFGEGIQVFGCSGVEVSDVELVGVDGHTIGDWFEPAVCRYGRVHNLFGRPRYGAAVVNSSGSFIDFAGCRDFHLTSVHGDGANNGYSFPGAGTNRHADNVTVTGWSLTRMGYGGVIGADGDDANGRGRVRLTSGLMDGIGGSVFPVYSATGGTTFVSDLTVRNSGGIVVTTTSRGVLVLDDVRFEDSVGGAFVFDQRTASPGDSQGIVIANANCTVDATYTEAIRVYGDDPLSAHQLHLKFKSAANLKMFGAITSTAGDFRNVDFGSGLLPPGVYPTDRLDVTTTDKYPLAGYGHSRGITSGATATSLPRGHKGQVHRIDVPAGETQTYQHAAGLRMVNGDTLVLSGGDSLTLRHDENGVWRELVRSKTLPVPVVPNTLTGFQFFFDTTGPQYQNGGSTPATATNDPVEQWYDRYTPATLCVYSPGGGKLIRTATGAVKGDGSANYLNFAPAGWATATSTFTNLLKIRWTTGAGSGSWWELFTSGSGFRILHDAAGVVQFYDGATLHALGTVAADTWFLSGVKRDTVSGAIKVLHSDGMTWITTGLSGAANTRLVLSSPPQPMTANDEIAAGLAMAGGISADDLAGVKYFLGL